MGTPTTLSVNCNNCGAPLEVAEATRFVTCGHCGAQLEIRHTETSHYTQAIEQIAGNTDRIAQDVQAIRRQNDVEQLDREWQMRSGEMISRDKHGNLHRPSGAGSAVGAVVAVVFGIFWTAMTASAGAPGFFVAIGIVFIVGAIAMGVHGALAASRYGEEERIYRSRRRQLLDETQDRDAV